MAGELVDIGFRPKLVASFEPPDAAARFAQWQAEYAGALAAELRHRVPDAEIFGFGGPRLQAAGGRLIGDYGPFAVTGLTEAVKVVPRSFAMLRRLVDTARDLRPHVFVAIDFPDFNFKLMAALRRLGIPIVY